MNGDKAIKKIVEKILKFYDSQLPSVHHSQFVRDSLRLVNNLFLGKYNTSKVSFPYKSVNVYDVNHQQRKLVTK